MSSDEKKQKSTNTITEVELLTWKLLLERQARVQLEFAAAQTSLQSHLVQLQKTYELGPNDGVDQNTGIIVRAPAPLALAPPPAPEPAPAAPPAVKSKKERNG